MTKINYDYRGGAGCRMSAVDASPAGDRDMLLELGPNAMVADSQHMRGTGSPAFAWGMGVALAVATIVLGVMARSASEPTSTGLGFSTVFSGALGLGAFFFAIIKQVSRQPMVFDRDAGVCYVGPHQARAIGEPIALKNIASVELAPAATSNVTAQVNIVLASPAEERYEVLVAYARDALRYAEQLAKFLDVPMVGGPNEGVE